MADMSQSSIAGYSNYLTNYSQVLECSTMFARTLTDGTATFTNNRITGLIDPVLDTQIANKNYSDQNPVGSSVSGQNTWLQYNTVGSFNSNSSLTMDGTTISANGFLIGHTYGAVVQDLTYYTNTVNSSVTVEYGSSGLAGSETVTVVGNAITVQIEPSVSTSTNIKDAILADFYSSNLVSCNITSGSGQNTQTTQSITSLTLLSTEVGAEPGLYIQSGRITNMSDLCSGYDQNYVSKKIVDDNFILTTSTISGSVGVVYTKQQTYNGFISRDIVGTDSTVVVVDSMPSALSIVSNTVSGTNPVLYALLSSTRVVSTLSGLTTVLDGVLANTNGSTVLLKNQIDKTLNGLWTISAGPWTRPMEFSTGSNALGYNIYVQQGQLGSGTEWTCGLSSTATSLIVDTDPLPFSRTPITTGSSFEFSVSNNSTASILQLSTSTGISFDPTSLSTSYIYPGYVLTGTVLVNSVLAGSESVTYIVETFGPNFNNSNFTYGPRSINNSVTNTLVRDNFYWNTKQTVFTEQNMVYRPTNIIGIVVRSFEGTKIDSFSAPASFISGFSAANSPITYIFGTGAVKMIIKNASTTGELVIQSSIGWQLDPNSNMTIPAGKTMTIWVYIDTVTVTGKIFVLSIS